MKIKRSNAVIVLIIIGIIFMAGCIGSKTTKKAPQEKEQISNLQNDVKKTGLDIIAQVKAEVIPKEGKETIYGIPLSLDNTKKFKTFYTAIKLTPEEEKIKDTALSAIPAPCCPDNPMSTCCCTCNLAKSVWGLSNYLIKEKGYNTDQVKGAALEWLHFIRESYYIKEELKNQGIKLSSVGLSPELSSCYTRRCSLPFREGGCGGMV